MHSSIDEIASKIKQIQKTPVLIGVEGFGGSGKTTLASKLKDALQDTYIIGIDDFIIKERLFDASPDQPGFDRARLEQEVLIPAHSGQPIAYRRLEWIENKLSELIEVPAVGYLIIEGISSTHPDIAGYYDFKIWVDVPIEVAKRRGKLRDVGNENEQHWDLWAENDLTYQQKYHPEQRADYVIDNSQETIIITTTANLWEKAKETGHYTQSTIDLKLDDVGFIHATSPDQTIAMLNSHFTDRDDILLLLVDLNKVQPKLKFEAPLSGKPGLFPHIYGPLNIDAVYSTIKPSQDMRGSFIETDELTKLAS
jgi:uridine kinase